MGKKKKNKKKAEQGKLEFKEPKVKEIEQKFVVTNEGKVVNKS